MPTSDDDWADLARELEVEKPAEPTAPPPEELFEAGEIGAEFPEGTTDSDSINSTGEDSDDAEPLESESEGDTGPDEGQPGTGRKRRRRRRRRRKGAGQATDSHPETAQGESEPLTEDEPESQAEYEPDTDESAEDDSVRTADDELAAAEEAGGELLRDLIANWNVPSWDDIVAGLHRP